VKQKLELQVAIGDVEETEVVGATPTTNPCLLLSRACGQFGASTAKHLRILIQQIGHVCMHGRPNLHSPSAKV
jgi:hypothetical protein